MEVVPEAQELSRPIEISLTGDKSPFQNLQKLKLLYPTNVSIAHININSIKNKFHINELLGENIDILIFSETKLDNSYPSSQFYISGYKKTF